MKKMTRSFQKMKKDMKRKMLRPPANYMLMCIVQTIIQPSPQVDPDEVEFSRLGKARDNTESEDESEKEAQATKVNTVQKDIWFIPCWDSVVTASQSKSQQQNLWYLFLEQHHFKNPQLVSMMTWSTIIMERVDRKSSEWFCDIHIIAVWALPFKHRSVFSRSTRSSSSSLTIFSTDLARLLSSYNL